MSMMYAYMLYTRVYILSCMCMYGVCIVYEVCAVYVVYIVPSVSVSNGDETIENERNINNSFSANFLYRNICPSLNTNTTDSI